MNYQDAIWILAVIIIMGLGSILLYRKDILTRNGSVATYLLGVYIFGILGINWGIPVAFFFVTSVIFTMINGLVNRKLDITGKRNVWQVMANIFAALVFSILFLIFSQPVYVFLYISAMAAVTADTWASEIGPVFQKKCFSLSGWKIADAGVSGGVSVAGTMASFAGSFLLSLFAWIGFFRVPDIQIILMLALAGFLASFIDTVLGAFMEPRLEKQDFFKKRSGTGNESISPNDVVNLMASFTAPVFYLVMSFLLS